MGNGGAARTTDNSAPGDVDAILIDHEELQIQRLKTIASAAETVMIAEVREISRRDAETGVVCSHRGPP